jgi:hypothetical protein
MVGAKDCERIYAEEESLGVAETKPWMVRME